MLKHPATHNIKQDIKGTYVCIYTYVADNATVLHLYL